MRPPLTLVPAVYNPKKKEPRPLALHFPNVMGDISDKEFQRVIKEVRTDEERRTAGAKRQQHIGHPHN